MKKGITFPVDNFIDIKIKMLNWANQFSIFCLLDNHLYNFEQPAFECLLAAGCKRKIAITPGDVFKKIKQFKKQEDEWLFGHIGYDVKNEIEELSSNSFDGIGFPDIYFFVPEIVIQLHEKEMQFFCEDAATAEQIFLAIQLCSTAPLRAAANPLFICSRMSKELYINTVKKLQDHILRGDCYEINFCQEFFAERSQINPVEVYKKLALISPNPFAALYKLENKFCICASPERYLKKTGNKILSQPIKGTALRNKEDSLADEISKHGLKNSDKEKSENVMIVDLVRNDLSKICKEGTVKVEELFGIYTFPQLHQMISTISGEVDDTLAWADAIKATFPMGSMTGAPKKKVMEFIEQYELTKRGLFSGSIGYIKPNGDFDFNVVIRSILFNQSDGYLSFQTGSAITFNSDPEKEYQECLLKAGAIKKVLE